MPPLNPQDPFLSKLASAVASSPDSILDRPLSKESNMPPYLDLFESPKLMASPAQVLLFFLLFEFYYYFKFST